MAFLAFVAGAAIGALVPLIFLIYVLLEVILEVRAYFSRERTKSYCDYWPNRKGDRSPYSYYPRYYEKEETDESENESED